MADSIRSIEVEKASLAVMKAQIENKRLIAEEDIQKALEMKSQLVDMQKNLEFEKNDLQEKHTFLGGAQRILDQRVEKLDQESQTVILEQKKSLDQLQKNLDTEKEQVANERSSLKEKLKHLHELEVKDLERKDLLALKETRLSSKESQILEREKNLTQKELESAKSKSDILEKERLVKENDDLIFRLERENESLKEAASKNPSANLEQEYILRQQELSKSIQSFNEFKIQLESSMKEREERYKNRITSLENEQKQEIRNLLAEKKVLEEQMTILEERNALLIEKATLSQENGRNPPPKAEYSSADNSRVIEPLKSRKDKSKRIEEEEDSELISSEKQRILEEAKQLEKEWMAVRLKEAEITKAMADISVAAAQQAVGSSISTAETLISRDQIRELEFENRELTRANKELQIQIEKINGPDLVSSLILIIVD